MPRPKTGEARGRPASVESSKDTYDKDWSVMILGPTGAGKSFCLGSFSEQWPQSWPPKKPVALDDTLWLSFDNGATRGFHQFGITVDEIRFNKYLDPTSARKTNNLTSAIRFMIDDTRDMVLYHNKRYVVIDAVSTLDYGIVGYWSHPDRMPKSKAGKPDGMALWRLVQSLHYEFISNLWNLPCNVGIASHEKPVSYDEDGVAQNKMTAHTPHGTHDFIPGISGQSLGFYLKNCDLVASILEHDTKTGRERKLHPVNIGGHMAKNRLQEYMNDEEDPHLRNLIQTLDERQKEARGK